MRRLLVAVVLALAFTGAARAAVPNPEARAFYVVNAANGDVLASRSAHASVPIASITKLMTALLVAEHTRNGDPVLITPDALHYSGSGVGLLPKGRHVSVKALLYGLLLPSGNDASIALADHVAHNQPRFVRMMNAKARSLGLRCGRRARSPRGECDAICCARRCRCRSKVRPLPSAATRPGAPISTRSRARRSSGSPRAVR